MIFNEDPELTSEEQAQRNRAARTMDNDPKEYEMAMEDTDAVNRTNSLQEETVPEDGPDEAAAPPKAAPKQKQGKSISESGIAPAGDLAPGTSPGAAPSGGGGMSQGGGSTGEGGGASQGGGSGN
jgi:hypothetical protein